MLACRAVVVVDVLALTVLAAAFARGLAIGMVREAFSVAALASACIAVRSGESAAREVSAVL